MRISLARSVGLAAVAAMAFALPACTKTVSGKYVQTGGVMVIEFHSGKATLSGMGNDETADYTVEGDKVIIKAKGAGDITLTIMKDGSLEGLFGTFKKSAG